MNRLLAIAKNMKGDSQGHWVRQHKFINRYKEPLDKIY